MGLTSWKNEKKGGKILKSDVSVAKNYLSKEEISELNTLVNMYLDYAELQAKKGIAMKMSDWADKLDSFLKFNEYDLLDDAGKIRKDVAKKFAESEYKKFRVKQDKEFVSDFDKVVSSINKGEKIPPPPLHEEPSKEEPLSDFNEKLKQGLEFDPKKDRKVSGLSLSSIKKRKEHQNKKKK